MDEEIFKISPDKKRAESLFEMAKERFADIAKETKTYKIIEEYYEIIKELLTAIIYIDGYKTLSHVKLLEYFSKNYKDLDEKQIKLIDELRKFRNRIVYYGEKISKEFLLNREKEIRKIISLLANLVKEKLS